MLERITLFILKTIIDYQLSSYTLLKYEQITPSFRNLSLRAYEWKYKVYTFDRSNLDQVDKLDFVYYYAITYFHFYSMRKFLTS